MLKIEKDEDFFYLATADFSSLQTVLASIDQKFNTGVPLSIAGNSIDQVMYDIYATDPSLTSSGVKGHGDMHSQTGFGVFCEGVELDVIEISLEDDSTVILHPNQKIKIIRNSEEKEILAKDLLESDDFVEKI